MIQLKNRLAPTITNNVEVSIVNTVRADTLCAEDLIDTFRAIAKMTYQRDAEGCAAYAGPMDQWGNAVIDLYSPFDEIGPATRWVRAHDVVKEHCEGNGDRDGHKLVKVGRCRRARCLRLDHYRYQSKEERQATHEKLTAGYDPSKSNSIGCNFSQAS